MDDRSSDTHHCCHRSNYLHSQTDNIDASSEVVPVKYYQYALRKIMSDYTTSWKAMDSPAPSENL
jgi:hypothetical protein